MLSTLLFLSTPTLAADYDRDPNRRRVEVRDSAGRDWKLARVAERVRVDATPEEAWQALASFGDVQEVHSSITDSYWIGEPEMDVGAARYCRIEQGKRVIDIKERVEEIETGSWYQYDVYAWENFPLAKMNNVWGIEVVNGETWIYNIIDYKLKPAMMTGLVRGTMRKNASGALLAYKHYLETGEGNADIDSLRVQYAHQM